MKLGNKMKKVLSFAIFGADVLPNLAQAIDRVMEKQSEKRRAKKEALSKEETCICGETCICEETPACEETCACGETCICEAAKEIPAVAEVETEAVEVASEESDDDDEDDADEDNEKERFGSTTGLVFFDAKANPEKYAELLEKEKKGEITVVTRYRHSFASRMAQAEEEVQSYYSILKNKILSYKGVRSRMSWAGETFNKGRSYVAKLDVKKRTIYLYLAMDPAEVAAMEDGKYHISDLSSKKKYGNVPVLFKIKGPRKMKYALELIELLCARQMELPTLKKFKEIDYKQGQPSIEALVESGDAKMMVCGVENGKA